MTRLLGDAEPGAASDIALRRLVHELNSPVGVAVMAASMLPAQLDGIAAGLDAQTRQQLALRLDECRETAALLQDSLQLAVRVLRQVAPAYGATPPKLPDIDLAATLRHALQVALARRPDLQVDCQLHLADGLRVAGDAGAWQQIMGNLVGNSLLHGFAGRQRGAIQVLATLLPARHLLLHYYDDGVGLSPAAQARLFEDGFSTRLGSGGSGLGMGIVKELVEQRMGGRIQVHSPAQGVHFSIEVPC